MGERRHHFTVSELRNLTADQVEQMRIQGEVKGGPGGPTGNMLRTWSSQWVTFGPSATGLPEPHHKGP